MDDKHKKMEEDRHQVSRVDLHNKKNKKDAENVKIFTLPFILVILLFLLPVAYLVTINWNNKADSFEDGNNKAGQSVSINENNQSGQDKEIIDGDDLSIDKENEAKEKEEEERIKKEEQEKKEQKEKKEKADEEKRLAAEKKKEEELAEQRKEQERKQQEEAEAERRKQEEQKQQAKTHTVQQGETLYRIAMNYYNNPDAVDRIRVANGLSGNEISVGQSLILP